MALEEPIQIKNMASFKVLFERYYPAVHLFIRQITGNECRAEEITQNVFIRLWLKRDRIDSDRNLRSFLYLLARHEIADYFRSENTYLNRRVLTEDVRQDGMVQEQVSSSLNVSDIREQVSDAVAKMPAKRQQIFRMSRVEGYSNEEIARRLHISKRTVEGHLNMALKTLRIQLGEFICWVAFVILAVR